MPTLGPFFKWLRPNHWKHVAIGPKSLGGNSVGDPERAWPQQQATSDDTLLGRSAEGLSYEVQEQQMTPREMDRAWMRGKGGKAVLKKDEIELEEREVER